MEANDLDVLVLGRQANVRYFSGAPQLWVAGTRPFGPICTVVRSTGEIHLNSTWDEGIPDDIPHDHLYGLAWNPMTLDRGVAGHRRRGNRTTRSGPTLSHRRSPSSCRWRSPAPSSSTGDRDARGPPDQDAATRWSRCAGRLRVAEDALAIAVGELRAGITEQALTGVLFEAEAAGGVSTPATQDGAWVTSREHPWRRARATDASRTATWSPSPRASWPTAMSARWAAPGQWVTSRAARSLRCTTAGMPCGTGSLRRAGPDSPPATLLAAYEAANEPLPPMPVAHGLGLGFDPPVVTPQLRTTAAEEILEPGMVLSVTGYVWQRGRWRGSRPGGRCSSRPMAPRC